jgi:hypothetical protein
VDLIVAKQVESKSGHFFVARIIARV